MDIKITKQNNVTFTLKKLGIYATNFVVSKPELVTDTIELDGYHGEYVVSRKYRRRTISIPFYAFVEVGEFYKKRDELFKLLIDTKSFFVEELNGGLMNYLFTGINEAAVYKSEIDTNVSGKRYTVHLLDMSMDDENNEFVEGELIFETIETPFAESINIIKRKYTTNSFLFKNGGTEMVDMRHQTETVMTFKGKSNNLTIKNLTTGDTWKYNGSTTADDEIKLIGVRSLKNGQSIFGDTNHKMIDFAPGTNKFELSGTSGEFEFNISTRFYFI